MSEKKSKIVMIAMFKNEAKSMRRMLESCYKYIDFFVIQNNGSTDGTDAIVTEFFNEKKIPGFLYNVDEGWVGFGWNRDHLIRTCQSMNHDCDWILKMDCDEVLEVDDDFDWSPLDNKETHAFHITAVSGSCMYHRAWMWNAKLPWRFNHDPCHETIYCEIEGLGENFVRVDLDKKFRQIGYNEGQSWSIPTKFISDALILEEKLIKEQSILQNPYHFWYIGKSYTDAWPCAEAFPLGRSQQEEYARRSIYYYTEYMNHNHDFANNKFPKYEDETCYVSLIFMAEAYNFLGDYDKAIESYKLAEPFAPGRNDHLFGLAVKYHSLNLYDKMLECTTEMMKPERTNPFPRYISFIDSSIYHDGGNRVQELHQIALDNSSKKVNMFSINTQQNKRLFVVDNFYSDPDTVREFALQQEFREDLRFYKGLRTPQVYQPPRIKEEFENIIGQKIQNFDTQGVNGCFQITTAKDPQVYHYDLQQWAAMIYLTPNAPTESGTRLHKSRLNGTRRSSDVGINEAFNGNFYDSTKFDVVDSAANFYNRLVIMDAKCIHSAGPYFGDTIYNGRLTHLFFFD